jgi:hypothetical protein
VLKAVPSSVNMIIVAMLLVFFPLPFIALLGEKSPHLKYFIQTCPNGIKTKKFNCGILSRDNF